MCFMDNKSQTSIGSKIPNKLLADGKAAKPKEKRRNNEKRKEKSRDAARCRRSRETEIFTELGDSLPIRPEELEHLDKASVMRLSIATLKVRDMLDLFKIDDNDSSDQKKIEMITKSDIDVEQLFSDVDENVVMKAMDGFLIVLSNDGDVVYASENINEFLGIQQIDIMGQQIWDYTHQCDHTELREALNSRRLDSTQQNDGNPKKAGNEPYLHRNVLIRIKCTLTSRGRSVNIKSASYKVINIVGHIVMDETKNIRQFIGIGRPIPHPSNIEVPLDSKTCLTKHSLDMKFSYVDDKMLQILGYKPSDLLDKSLYECHHGADSETLMAAFKNVINKGQTETSQYRFLARNGGYCWVVTQATLVYDKQKPQSVVCVNYVISEIKNKNEIYSCGQLEAYNKLSESEKLKLKEFECIEKQQQQNQYHDIDQKSPTKVKLELDAGEQNNNNNNKFKLENNLKPLNINTEQQFADLQKASESIYKRCIPSTSTVPLQFAATKPNPKTVTASVFKTIQASVAKNSHGATNVGSLNTAKLPLPTSTPKSVTASIFLNAPTVAAPANNPIRQPQSVTASLIQSIANVKRSKQQNTDYNIAEPSVIPRQTVVTASVLQPRNGTVPVQKLNSVNQQTTARTEAMNKAFLMFSDDIPQLTMLKEEPDDLQLGSSSTSPSSSTSTPSSLSPVIAATGNNCGIVHTNMNLRNLSNQFNDSCIPPLDDSAPLFGEIFDELILPDGYGTLLPDDISSLDSQSSKINVDPFMNYRDDSCDTIGTPNMLSPDSLSKSPEGSSIPSLCSPNSLSQEDEFAFMSTKLDNDDIDLSMRAPYIPMNENDDLPLLTEDLMWSAFSDELSLHKEMKDATLQQQLLLQQHNQQPLNTTTTITALNLKDSSNLAALFENNFNQNCKQQVQLSHENTNQQQQQQRQQQFENNDNNNQNLNNNNNNNNTATDVLTKTQQFLQQTNTTNNNNNFIGKTVNIIRPHNNNNNNNNSNINKIILDGSTKMEIIDANDGSSITAYTVEMIDDDTYTKNCTTALPLWTMTDLLQLNGNTLTASNNKAYLFPTAQLNTKRQISKKSDGLTANLLLQTGTNNDNMNVSYTNHKRPSSIDMNNAKRLKSALGSVPALSEGQQAQRQRQNKQNVQQQQALQTAPQLLQQLMAPTPQRHRKGKESDGRNGRNKDGSLSNDWNMDSSFQQQQQHLNDGDLQSSGMSPSNSVLKNLLGDLTMKPPDDLLENNEQPPNKSSFKAIKPEDEPNELKLNLIDDDEINAMRMEDSYVLDRVSPFYYFNPLGDTISIGSKSCFDSEKKSYDEFEEHALHSPAPPPPLRDGFLGNTDVNKRNIALPKPASMPSLMDMDESDGSEYSSPAMVPAISDDDDIFERNLFGNTNGDIDDWTNQMT